MKFFQQIIRLQYYLKVISDKWIKSESIMPISFRNLVLPSQFPESSVVDKTLEPLPISNIFSTCKNLVDFHLTWRTIY